MKKNKTYSCILSFSVFLLAWSLTLSAQEKEYEYKEAEIFYAAGFGEQFELTITFPRFEAGESVPLTMYLAEVATNRPVEGAEITLTLTGPDTEKKLTPVPTEMPGEYTAQTTINSESAHAFFVEATAGDDMDMFEIKGFGVPDKPAALSGKQQPGRLKDLFFMLGGIVIAGCIGFWLGSRARKTKSI